MRRRDKSSVVARRFETKPTDVTSGLVVSPPCQVKNLPATPRDGRGGDGEFTLILIINSNGFAEDVHRLNARHPCKILVDQERIVTFQCGQVMSVSIAVALRVKLRCVSGI